MKSALITLLTATLLLSIASTGDPDCKEELQKVTEQRDDLQKQVDKLTYDLSKEQRLNQIAKSEAISHSQLANDRLNAIQALLDSCAAIH